jgi:transposase
MTRRTPHGLTAVKAKTLLGSVRPRDEVGKVRKALALDQLADLVAIDKRLKDIGTQIKTVIAETHTSVTDVRGVGPVVAAIVIGEVRDVSRFPTKHHFASYNGTAPTTWGSAGDARPCVNLHGNRRLNHAIHIAAIVQLRFDCDGRRYYQRKIADGKTPKEARRCLKRRISDADLSPATGRCPGKRAGPGRADGGDYEDQRGRPSPDGRLFDQATTRTPRTDSRATGFLTTERCHSRSPAVRGSASEIAPA